ncbi:prophage tail fiber N-terminal domain-containing protein [Escherichia coli]|nr:prophage tail fiber N-terminal domain-containing protein [Escherichia coli]MDY9321218.1 prophage tail fiber N-terminal domain-containing protein [Escherichia coli]MDY9354198.1 prophage tail fiber N-terminal domain-containing protein [Escherichia coli]MDY9396413.1 prophage tail fiber N-terminal domain-containing protein [Escherichia coli]MDY9450378.1 prophage tail fiber N-terminal domain-containing protein [Escherichia coli]
MAAVKISGVLKDGAGKPIQNCTIQLKAKRNSTTVLVNTVASENPDEAGRYSMDVEYGQYSVILWIEGSQPSHVGTITVYEDSKPGTLNDFLGAMTEDDARPEALRRFELIVEEAARNAEAASQSAAAAKKSETAAASSKNAAKTSETNAANSAQAAATSQTASANSATAAKKSETNAKNSETAAKTSETNAKSSQTAAKTSETNAKASETAAKSSQDAAAQSESAAASSASAAAASATASANSQKAAKTSETNAKASQTAAKTSENNAAKSASDALGYRNEAQAIVGTDIGLGGTTFRDWPDCTVNPSGYIGFCRMAQSTGKGFPTDATGEGYLLGWLARATGALIQGCFVGAKTLSLYTYIYNTADNTYSWGVPQTNRENEWLRQQIFQNIAVGRNSTSSGVGMEIGSVKKAGTSYVDFHSSGTDIDYDARIAVTGGDGVNNGKGNMQILAESVTMKRLELTSDLAVGNGGTGASNAENARTNLQAMLEQKTTLESVDLDTLTGSKSGVYWQGASSKATEALHYPCPYGGALVVLKNGNYTEGCTQLYYPYNYASRYYSRTYHGGNKTWTEWEDSDRLKHEEKPLPDVWIPFNDSLDMITGFSPSYKKIIIGDDEITMPGDKIVKFKRASTATYIDKAGWFTIAAIDEPRFELDGLLLEGQRTNYMLNSESPASWGRSSNMDVPESGVDSFGFTYGKFVCKDSLVGQTSSINMASIAAAKGVDVSGTNKYVTTSCRFKTDLDVRIRIRFDKYDGSANTFLGDVYINTATLELEFTGGAANRITCRVKKDDATGWVFCEATLTAVDGELQIGSQIQYAPKKGGATVSGDYVYLATPQVEDGRTASSFIISGTSATTRASDLCTVPCNKNLYKAPFTILVEVHKNWYQTPNAAPRVFDTTGHQSGAAIILAFGSSADYDGFPYCDIGGSNRRVNENASLEKMVMGMRVRSDYSTCSVSNSTLSSETKTTWRYITRAATLRIGGQTATGERHLFGHVRNMRIWHKELTNEQMKENA